MRISDWSSDVCSSDLTTVCQEDLTQNYGVITPEIERFGFSGRVTAKIGDSSEAYGELNFLQTEVSYDGLPSTIRGNRPAPSTEEPPSEPQPLMRISFAAFSLKKKKKPYQANKTRLKLITRNTKK